MMAWPFYLLFTGEKQPLLRLKKDFLKHRNWLLAALAAGIFTADVLGVSSAIKKSIPTVVPFYADPMLADVEQNLLGQDAWRFTHDLVSGPGTYFISNVYSSWYFAKIGISLYVAFCRDLTLKLQSALSLQLSWFLLGGLLAMGLSSVGPCFYHEFYDSDRFLPLMETLPLDVSQRKAMAYLLTTQGTDSFANGISAMPSMHVGIAVLIALVCGAATRGSWLKGLAWLYVALIWFGSVHIGWHYALDGLVSIVGVLIIWWASGQIARALLKRGHLRSERSG